jgi:lipopolysaccharide biosynthesis protein
MRLRVAGPQGQVARALIERGAAEGVAIEALGRPPVVPPIRVWIRRRTPAVNLESESLTGPSVYSLAIGRLYRLRAGKAAHARGYLRVALKRRDGAERDILAPLGGGLDLLLKLREAGAIATVCPDEAVIETVGLCATTVALFRRRFTSLKRSVLNFGAIEVFPEGSKAKTRRFRKQINVAFHSNMAFDSPLLTIHPELFVGWPAEAAVNTIKNDVPQPAIAIALHLHYVELWAEVETLLRRWRAPFTLFLTLTRENAELEAQVRSAFRGAVVRVVENRGRDVRPFLLLLEEGAFDSFDLVCKIHGKRSLSGDRLPIFGDIMRRAAFLDLIADDRRAQAIVRRFVGDPKLGLVGPRRFLSASRQDAQRDVLGAPNRENVEALAAKMGAPIRHDDFDFFEGTMFWARPQALAPLRRLGLAVDSFAPELGQVDGALEHAVERLFNHAARVAGFRVEDTSVDD